MHHRRGLAPPLLAFLASRALVCIAAASGGVAPFAAESFKRWDSGHYLSIAARGYEFVSCKAIGYPSPDDWCGNAAWFPGYSWLIRAVTWTGADPTTAGATLSAAFFLGALIALWLGLLDRGKRPGSLEALAAAAFFPGVVYDHAIFPVALVTLLLVLGIHLTARPSARSLSGATAAAYYSAVSYTTGLVLGVGLAAGQMVHGFTVRAERRSRAFRALALGGGAVLGFFTVLAVQWADTGYWNASFLEAHKYFVPRLLPLQSLFLQLEGLSRWSFGFTDVSFAIAVQAALTALLVGGSTFLMIRKWRDFPEVTRFAVLVALLYWIFPHLTGGHHSFYRGEACCLPVVAALPFWPKAARLALIPVLAGIAFAMARLFFQSLLV